MKTLRTFFACAVILGLGYSQCTGGLFAIPAALANGYDAQNESVSAEEPLMSSEPNICFADIMSHAQEEDHEEGDHIEQGHENGCGDGAPCVRQTQQVLTMDRTRSASVDKDTVHIGSLTDATLPYHTPNKPTFLARAGPLHEHSTLLAHTLIKRE